MMINLGLVKNRKTYVATSSSEVHPEIVNASAEPNSAFRRLKLTGRVVFDLAGERLLIFC